MKSLLLTLSMLFLTTSVRAGDFIWGPGGYVAHLEQIVGHAGRGATPEEVQNAGTTSSHGTVGEGMNDWAEVVGYVIDRDSWLRSVSLTSSRASDQPLTRARSTM